MEIIAERVFEATQPQSNLREAIIYENDMLYLVSEEEVMDSRGLLFRKEFKQVVLTPWEAEEEITRIAPESEEAKKKLQQVLQHQNAPANTSKPATPKQKAFLRNLLKKQGKGEEWIKEKTRKGINELTSKEISTLITELTSQ
jgi:hypothetical protein